MKIWINADDFGLTKTCTDAILDCFKKGLITTTTLVATGDYFSYAIEKVKGTKYANKIGLHINLTEGRPLTKGISENKKFCDKNGNFIGFPKRYSKLTKRDREDVFVEIEAQFDKIIESGISINHVDSHHHIHNSFRVLPILISVMRKKNIKLLRISRNAGKIKLSKKIYKKIINLRIKKYSFSRFMGSMDDFKIAKRKKDHDIFEIMVHPDYNNQHALIDRNNGDYDNPLGPPFKHEYEILR